MAGAAGMAGASGAAGTTAGTAGGDASGMGGAGGASGMAAVDAGNPYTCEEPEPEPGGTATDGMPCCGGLGVCSMATGADSEAYGLDACMAGAGLKCVPAGVTFGDGGVGDAGADMDAAVAAIPMSCRVARGGGGDGGVEDGGVEDGGLGDAGPDGGGAEETSEGRCIPECFMINDPAAENLDQSTCATAEKCVPCYSPITGESTGACNRNGDAPVEPPPASGFTECGGDVDAGTAHGGYCVPGGAASSMGGNSLEQLNCEVDEVCAPKFVIENPSACFPRCNSIGGLLPGACIATFLLGDNVALLPPDTCEPGTLCAPCVSPLSGMRTGACDPR